MLRQRVPAAVAAVLTAVVVPLSAVTSAGGTTASAAAPNLFFSEYIEGSSNSKALEIFNGTGAAVDLTANGYNVQMFFNGASTAGLTVNLTGSVADGDVFVLAQALASPLILAQADQTNGSGWFNGDDAVVLRQGTTVLDVIGQIGFDPGTEWGTGVVSTADNTLRRLPGVCAGDANGGDAFAPATEWDGFATDTFDGLGAHACGPTPDAAPAVQTTVPSAGATEVAVDSNITVTFTEPVDVTGSWFAISCSASGPHTAVASGGPTTFTLDPDLDFTLGEQCTVTVTAAQVTDQDTDDPPDPMLADAVVGFTVTAQACGQPFTPISQIQGGGDVSPLAGQSGIATEAVVTGDHQGPTGLNGFFLEDPVPDANPATSEGVFVFVPAASPFAGVDVAVGDTVRVAGRVTEFQQQTEVDNVTTLIVCSPGAPLAPVVVTLPETTNGDLERFEGMYVSIPQTLTVQQNFFQGRFGQVTLASGGRLATPTDVYPAGTTEAIAELDSNLRRMIVLDDAFSGQNPNPTPYIGDDNTLRAGDDVSGLVGNIDFGAVNSSTAIRDYRIQPTAEPVIRRVNARQNAPDPVGGEVAVASFNVLNYFNGDGLGGGFPTSRGATNPAEFTRQRDKIIAAISAMDASVVGLMELENDPLGNSAIEDLVSGLNAATAPGTYAFIDTGVVGGDEIRVGLLYQPAEVAPIGLFKTLTHVENPLFDDTRNRPALAQTFRTVSGATFTVVVNHLKSKGSECAGDPDIGDGQGNCNLTRVQAATALAQWIATDPTGSGDPDYLIIGDLNSYGREDPILTLEDAGFANLVEAHVGVEGYSYVFDGMSGSLDQALSTASLASQVTGVTEWHINADEPSVIDYNLEFKPQDLYTPTPFRSSDHDPVLIGLCQAPTLSMSVNPALLRPANHMYRTVTATPTASADVVDIALLSAVSSEPDNGPNDGNTVNDVVIVDDLTLRLRAERVDNGPGRTYTMTWQATNGCGATTTTTASVFVPAS